MQSDNSFINDFSKMMGGFVGAAQGLQKETVTQFESFIQKQILDAGFVHKDDIKTLEMKIQTLEQRIKDLEDQK